MSKNITNPCLARIQFRQSLISDCLWQYLHTLEVLWWESHLYCLCFRRICFCFNLFQIGGAFTGSFNSCFCTCTFSAWRFWATKSRIRFTWRRLRDLWHLELTGRYWYQLMIGQLWKWSAIIRIYAIHPNLPCLVFPGHKSQPRKKGETLSNEQLLKVESGLLGWTACEKIVLFRYKWLLEAMIQKKVKDEQVAREGKGGLCVNCVERLCLIAAVTKELKM